MDLNGILAITGKPGLYKLISQTKSGALVESLVDKRRMPAFSNERISSLKDITMFTNDDDIPLQEVFQSIFRLENGGDCISHKSDEKELKAYMEKVLPEYDRDRVHTSDMKKLFSWYNILNANKLIDLEEEKQESQEN
ncbi:MAG: DUF5606 domain-containing protein [Bacteroidales bacterium]|nr:DUF5606 domain-containing protein [Candidatus Scybalousia scybalohippi]MCQ2326114.1 DUF5606 domain-containing protein [Bacteroidales bacterium]